MVTLWSSLTAAVAQVSEGRDQPLIEQEAVVAGTDAQETEVDLGLLEFLGLWETDSGEWISPDDLADASFVELIPTNDMTEIEAID